MIVRRERPADIAIVRSIHAAAFPRRGDDEPAEAGLLDELRVCDGWIPALSMVAVIDDIVVGHVVCTRAFVDDVACLGLGPIAVAPALQHMGFGSALVHASIGAADGLDEPLIGLLGSPDYYSRFGFVPSTGVGVSAPDPSWGVHFQVRILNSFSESTRGTFRYSEPFNHL